MRLRYVDLFAPETILAVFGFLGVNQDVPINLKTTRKQNTSSIAERYTQPDLVQDYLARIGKPEWAIETLIGSN